jgi:hypothetical protein
VSIPEQSRRRNLAYGSNERGPSFHSAQYQFSIPPSPPHRDSRPAVSTLLCASGAGSLESGPISLFHPRFRVRYGAAIALETGGRAIWAALTWSAEMRRLTAPRKARPFRTGASRIPTFPRLAWCAKRYSQRLRILKEWGYGGIPLSRLRVPGNPARSIAPTTTRAIQ